MKRVSAKAKRTLEKEIARIAKSIGEDEEIVDASVPGAKLDRFLATARKVPFTMSWFEQHYPKVSVIPEATMPVTINGVKVQFIAGQKVEVPEPFANEYFRYRQHIRKPYGSTFPQPREGVLQVEPGAGGLIPESEGG